MQQLINRYEDRFGEDFRIETDFSSNVTIFTADLVITDWSGIAHEFSYATKRPSLFVNTPMKVLNPEHDKIKIVPLELALRTELGTTIDPDKMDEVAAVVAELLDKREDYAQHIAEVLDQNVFNLGHSGEATAHYVMDAVAAKADSSYRKKMCIRDRSFGVGCLLRGKIRGVYTSLVFGAGLAFWLQGNFLNLDLGIFNGQSIQWELFRKQELINLGIWFLCLAVPVAIYLWRKKLWNNALRILAGGLVAIQAVTLSILFFKIGRAHV